MSGSGDAAAAAVTNVCRWGILSTAGIATRVCDAIKGAPHAEIAAVASRSLDKAAAWAKANGVPVAYGTYEELLADATIDAVYVPLPTGLHREWCIKVAEAGKHVLCEKPVGASVADVAAIVQACNNNRVQFMDGVMFMHNERLPVMKRRLYDDACVGTVKRVTSGFTFFTDDTSNIRFSPELEPMGCLGDLGWYCTRFSLWAFNYDVPARVRATHWVQLEGSGSGAGRPWVEFDATLSWADGRVASFDTGFRSAKRQCAEILGDRGRLTLQDFCSNNGPDDYEFVVYGVGGGAGAVTRVTKTAPQAQHEVECFSNIVLAVKAHGASKLEPFWCRIALVTQAVLDACLRSALNDGAAVDVDTSAFGSL